MNSNNDKGVQSTTLNDFYYFRFSLTVCINYQPLNSQLNTNTLLFFKKQIQLFKIYKRNPNSIIISVMFQNLSYYFRHSNH